MPAFHLHQGNDLEVLAGELSAQLDSAIIGAHDPLHTEVVVVPDSECERWLRTQIADKSGICANIRFLFPGKFLYEFVFDPMSKELNLATGATGDVSSGSEKKFEPATVRWRLFRLLMDLTNAPAGKKEIFRQVLEYIGDDTFRRFQLASRLAELFDRYMTYRPDVLNDWENGKNSAGTGGVGASSHATTGDAATGVTVAPAVWQAELWRDLLAQTSGKTLHFSGLLNRFLLEMRRGGPLRFLSSLRDQKQIFFFGNTTLPPAHLTVLRHITECGVATVRFFALNPCETFWSDAKSQKQLLRETRKNAAAEWDNETLDEYLEIANPLLGSLGATGRDLFTLLLDQDATEHNHFSTPPNDNTDDAGTTLLARIQTGILQNLSPKQTTETTAIATAAVTGAAGDDDSLRVHVCHSAEREVEVLHDQLLAFFKNDPTLRPGDIRVYVPEIEKYAPFIENIFGNAKTLLGCAENATTAAHTTGGARSSATIIPFAIAGQRIATISTEVKTFLALLETVSGRFTASSVLGLLEQTAVAERFNISREEYETIALLLKKANLAWGIDTAFREKAGAGGSYANTWRFALDRLILGAATATDADNATAWPITDGITGAAGGATAAAANIRECVPCETSANIATLLGKLADFLEKLFALHERCAASERRLPEHWDALQGALSTFFKQTPESAENLAWLRSEIGRLRAQSESAAPQKNTDDTGDNTAGFADAAPRVPFSVVWSCVKEALSAPKPATTGDTIGKVRFSPFQTICGAPAKIVCMLGLNDGTFPRGNNAPSFDLLAGRGARRIGDRTSRDTDRYAFLLTLMAARQKLVITYTGRGNKDNKEIPPSVLLSELLDHARAITGAADNAAQLVHHPLHPFSERYFEENGDPRLFSFNATCFAVALETGKNQRTTPPPAPPTETLTPAESPPKSTPPLPTFPTIANPAAGVSVSLDDLAAFLRSPCRYFYDKKLGVRFEIRQNNLPDDDEPLELDTRRERALERRLLDIFGALPAEPTHEDFERVEHLLAAAGDLPLNAREAVTKVRGVAAGLIAKKHELGFLQKLPPQHAKIQLVSGTINITFANSFQHAAGVPSQLFMRPSPEKGTDAARTALYNLATRATGGAGTTVSINFDRARKKDPFLVRTCAQFTPDEARDRLALLLEWHNQIMRIGDIFTGDTATGNAALNLPCYCADSAFAWFMAVQAGKSPEDAERAARSLWEGGFNTPPAADECLRREHGATFPAANTTAFAQFTRLAQDVHTTLGFALLPSEDTPTQPPPATRSRRRPRA